MSVTKDEVPDKVKVNNVQLIASFKELLKDTAGQIKRANDTSAELPMKEAKELKFREPLKFKRAARRTVQIQSQTCGDLRQRQVRCREDQPREVKSDLEECEKLLVEQQKRILLANKSKYGCGKTEHWHARCPAMTKWSGFLTSK